MLQYDGDAIIREISPTALLRRHVHGPGVDEPLVWYEGAGLSDKRYAHADERGSIIATSNASGTVTQINAYDDYGIPQGKSATGALLAGGAATAMFGRFGYSEHRSMPGAWKRRAAKAWVPEVGLYHYKNRTYSPTLGRFMQADPIGYGDGVNLYAYVGGDPINATDPLGLEGEDIVVNGLRDRPEPTVRLTGEDLARQRLFDDIRQPTPLGSGLLDTPGDSAPEAECDAACEAEKLKKIREIKKNIAILEKLRTKLARQICLRAVAEGALGGALGPEAVAVAIGSTLTTIALREGSTIAGAAFPAGRFLNAVRASGVGLLAGVIVGYGAGGTKAFLNTPSCGEIK